MTTLYKKGAVTAQWGKFGIINESKCVLIELSVDLPTHVCSIHDKQAEFHTWLVEERVVNPETLSKDMTKKEFARYMEDFNTGAHALLTIQVKCVTATFLIVATLPHEKYYNMAQFENRMAHVRNGETITVPDDGYDPNADFAAHSSSLKVGASSKEVYMSKDQLQELRRVQNERIQVRVYNP